VVLVALPGPSGCERPGHEDVLGRTVWQQVFDVRAFGPKFETCRREVPKQGNGSGSESAPGLQGKGVGKLSHVVDGRPSADVSFEVVGELFEKVLLINKQDRRVVVEVPLQETVLAIEGAAIRMGDKEFARALVFLGPWKGSDAGTGVVGKHEDLTFHARVVSLKRK
jgi:hypothetical protein